MKISTSSKVKATIKFEIRQEMTKLSKITYIDNEGCVWRRNDINTNCSVILATKLGRQS